MGHDDDDNFQCLLIQKTTTSTKTVDSKHRLKDKAEVAKRQVPGRAGVVTVAHAGKDRPSE